MSLEIALCLRGRNQLIVTGEQQLYNCTEPSTLNGFIEFEYHPLSICDINVAV
jgi:hypothetical protein